MPLNPERQAHTLATVPIGGEPVIRVLFVRMEGRPPGYFVELQAQKGPQRLVVPAELLADLVDALQSAQIVHDVARHTGDFGGLNAPRVRQVIDAVAGDVEAKRARRASPEPRRPVLRDT